MIFKKWRLIVYDKTQEKKLSLLKISYRVTLEKIEAYILRIGG